MSGCQRIILVRIAIGQVKLVDVNNNINDVYWEASDDLPDTDKSLGLDPWEAEFPADDTTAGEKYSIAQLKSPYLKSLSALKLCSLIRVTHCPVKVLVIFVL